MNIKNIGIWGYGTTGKSATTYFYNQGNLVQVIDQKSLPHHELQELAQKNITFLEQTKLEEFLQNNDQILASPGIDLRPHAGYKDKWITELDIFHAAFEKPIIAITGSIGKTTITHLTSLILQHTGKKVLTGGNIGIPMLDLLEQKNDCDLAVLEVSSFQLEHCKTFAPQLAIITNLYPNHLDRHGTEQEYLEAKAKICAYQNKNQHTLIPFALKEKVTSVGTLHFFAQQKPAESDLKSLNPRSKLFYNNGSSICVYHKESSTPLIKLSHLPTCTFEENWLIICAALTILDIKVPNLLAITALKVPEHRMEKVATISGIDFYNDSKSTTAQSTLAAVKQLQNRPIILLLGGLSKGVDRSELVHQLHGKVKKIICFGKEAQQLKAMCNTFAITAQACENLEEALQVSTQDAAHGDQILLSPAGSSFDLYKNYIERGNHFKKLVHDFNAHI